MTDRPGPDKDRRRHPRIPHNEPIFFSPVTEIPGSRTLEVVPAFLVAKVLNLSENGVCLEILESAPQTQILLVHLELPAFSPNPAMIYAKKTWEKGNIVGFEFMVIHEQERSVLERHVKRKIKRPG